MPCSPNFPSKSLAQSALRGGLASLVLLVATASAARAQAPTQYRSLVAQIPSGANTVMIYNVQKILASPMGVRQGWDKNLQKAFDDGICRVPPQAEGFVLASQMDFEFLKPIWEAAAVKLRSPLSIEEIAKRRHAAPDMLEGLKAAKLPNDTYVVQLDKNTLAAMGPANRQLVLQWVREIKTGAKTSAYLQEAAGYSDEAGTEVILAMDVAGAFAPETIRNYLQSKQELLKSVKTSPQQAATLLASVRGVRIGIRITERAYGKLVVDAENNVNLSAEACKALLMEIMSDAGIKIGDLQQFKAEAKGKEFSLGGYLSESGLRRIFTLVESPMPTQTAPETQAGEASPSSEKGQMAANTLRQFEAITKMFNDLKQDWRDLKSLSCVALFFERYAKRIEKLPVLNVDPDMLKYRDFVAVQFRAAAESGRTMNIRGSYRQSGIGGTGASGAGAYYGYDNGYYGGYRSGWYGGYGVGGVAVAQANATNAFYDATRAQGAQRRAVRNEERNIMATDVQSIRANVIDATNQIRRMMTQRYQVEF